MRCACLGAICRLDSGDPRHGTTNGYTNLSCRCERCRTANAHEARRTKANRRSRVLPEQLHGSDNGYSNWGCRCARCRAGHAAVATARYHRRKAGLTDVVKGLVPKPKPR